MMKKIATAIILLLFFSSYLPITSAVFVNETDDVTDEEAIINLLDYNPEINHNQLKNFEISITNIDNQPLPFDSYNVYTLPSEELSIQRQGNTLLGYFTPTKEGIYSLIIEIKSNEETFKEIYYYIVNAEASSVKYYFRDINPTHGQPGDGKGDDGDHGDLKALVLDPPDEGMEYWKCARWVQSSPDEIPEDMAYFSILTSVDTGFWYQVKDFLYFPISRMGIQRFATKGTFVNRFNRIKPTPRGEIDNPDDYSWTNKKISCLYWPMTSEQSWYFLSIKIAGDCPYVMTIPEQPSYAEFSYLYYDALDIKIDSNPSVKLLSATLDAENKHNAEITLQGEGKTDIVVQMNDKSVKYTALINNVKTDIIQRNGELVFDDIDIDLDDSYSVISINEKTTKSNYKQKIGFFYHLFIEKYPLIKDLLNL